MNIKPRTIGSQKMLKIKEFQKEVHALARSKGWYDTDRSPLELQMLIVSEIAEATEAVRKGVMVEYGENGKPEGEASEMADALIRILDYCEYRGIDLEDMILKKHEFNKTRSYRHGGKKY